MPHAHPAGARACAKQRPPGNRGRRPGPGTRLLLSRCPAARHVSGNSLGSQRDFLHVQSSPDLEKKSQKSDTWRLTADLQLRESALRGDGPQTAHARV